MQTQNEKWRLIARKLSGEANQEELRRLSEITTQDHELSLIVAMITEFWNSRPSFRETDIEASLTELSRIRQINKNKDARRLTRKQAKKK